MPLDIALGIFIAHFLGQPLWLGILFMLLPDFDMIFKLNKLFSEKAHEHRSFFHHPIPYLVLGGAGVYALKPEWLTLFLIGGLLHFIHDSIGMGWGVPWLSPLNSDHFAFFGLYQPKNRPLLPKRLMYRWKKSELPEISAKYGDPQWIQNIYLKGHPLGLFEWAMLIGAVSSPATR
jgi:hypothetical protein